MRILPATLIASALATTALAGEYEKALKVLNDLDTSSCP
jgi:hypothetical protein